MFVAHSIDSLHLFHYSDNRKNQVSRHSFIKFLLSVQNKKTKCFSTNYLSILKELFSQKSLKIFFNKKPSINTEINFNQTQMQINIYVTS